MDKPEWMEHLGVLRIEPGDVLVLRSGMSLSLDVVNDLQKSIERVFPGVKCVVLSDGLELGVVRQGDPSNSVEV